MEFFIHKYWICELRLSFQRFFFHVNNFLVDFAVYVFLIHEQVMYDKVLLWECFYLKELQNFIIKNIFFLTCFKSSVYSFQLNPPNKTKQQMLSAPPDLAPVVGVSIVLRKEDMVNYFIFKVYKPKIVLTCRHLTTVFFYWEILGEDYFQ